MRARWQGEAQRSKKIISAPANEPCWFLQSSVLSISLQRSRRTTPGCAASLTRRSSLKRTHLLPRCALDKFVPPEKCRLWGKAQSSSQGWMLARLVALPWDVLLPESSYPVIKRGITYLTLGPEGGERQKSHLHTPCTATHIIQVAAPLCSSAQHKLCSFCLASSFPRTTVPCSGVAAIIVLLPPLGRNPPKQAHRPDLCTSRWFLFPGKWCSHWIKEGWDASGPCFLKSGELN